MKTVTTTTSAPFHKPNQTINVADVLADKMLKHGWATEGEQAPIADEPIADEPIAAPAQPTIKIQESKPNKNKK